MPAIATAPLSAEQRGGQALYADYCWTCHGLYGHGDGPGARGFPEPLPDLSRVAATRTVDDIASRLRAPPRTADPSQRVWHALDSAQSRAAAAYIKTFAPPGSRGNPAAGRLLYAVFCVHCHGVHGAGDGRLVPRLARRPIDLRSPHAASLPNHMFEAIKSGSPSGHGRYMPRWGQAFSDQEVWDLVAYIRLLRAGR